MAMAMAMFVIARGGKESLHAAKDTYVNKRRRNIFGQESPRHAKVNPFAAEQKKSVEQQEEEEGEEEERERKERGAGGVGLLDRVLVRFLTQNNLPQYHSK